MNSVSPPSRRTIVVRADRETLVLLAAVLALTLAIGHSARSRALPPAQPIQSSPEQAAGEWAGRLAEIPASDGAVPHDTMSTAALTVPKTAMALPTIPKPAGIPSAKPRTCEGAACPPTKVAATATPARHTATRHPIQEASLLDRINPLNHLPRAVKQPFASAGNAVAGWLRSF